MTAIFLDFIDAQINSKIENIHRITHYANLLVPFQKSQCTRPTNGNARKAMIVQVAGRLHIIHILMLQHARPRHFQISILTLQIQNHLTNNAIIIAMQF